MPATNPSVKKSSKRLKVGWFIFTCCEDSTVVFVEMMNERFFEWEKVLDIRYCRALKKNGDPKDLDVAFVEGAISSKEEEEKLAEIRKNCKLLVAVGSCACNGMPSAQRNNFSEKTKSEIKYLVEKFKLNDKVYPVKHFVTVDAEVPGCPMVESKFLEVVDFALKKFEII